MAEKDIDSKLDAIAAHLDSLHKRMDSEAEERKADKARFDAACSKMDAAEEERKADKARKDAEEMAMDKSRKDAAEKEEEEKKEKAKADAEEKEKEEKAKADAVRADAARLESSGLADRLKALEAHIKDSPDDRAQFVAAQLRAEKVAQAFGDSAERWLVGENVTDYRARMASKYKTHAKKWKDVELTKLTTEVLAIAEEQIYADAYEAALHPASAPEGRLRTITEKDHSGRTIYRFVGSDTAAWAPFSNPDVRGRFTRPPQH